MSKKITYARYPKLRKRKVTKTYEQGFGQNGGVSSLGTTYEDLDSDGELDTVVKDSHKLGALKRTVGVTSRPYLSQPAPVGPPDNAPTSTAIADMDGTGTVTLSDHFFDDDGDAFTYEVSSSDTDVATVSETGGILTVTEGTVYGTATITVTGTANGKSTSQTFDFTYAFGSTHSFSLDATNDYLRVDVGQDIDLFGISMWFNSNQTFGTTPHAGVLFGSGHLDWFLALGGNYTSALDNEIISIAKGERYGCDSYDDGSGTPATTISAGDWHHIAAAWSNTSATNSGNPGCDIYLDGNKVGNIFDNRPEAEVPTPSMATLTSGQWYTIGIRQNLAYPFRGKIDEVAIFSSTISEADVAAMHANGPGDLESFAPTGWWRMGEGATWDGVAGAWTIPDLGKIAGTTTSSNNHAVSVNMSESNLVTDTP